MKATLCGLHRIKHSWIYYTQEYCHLEYRAENLLESESHSVMLYSTGNSPGQNTGVDSISLLQEIFPTQGSNPGLLHCWWIVYQLSWGVSNFCWGYTNFICLFTEALFSGVLEIWVSNFFDTLNSPTFGGFWHHFMKLSNSEKFKMEKKFPKAVKLGALS